MRRHKMVTRIATIFFVFLGLTFGSFAANNPVAAKKKSFNRDLAIKNLLIGVNSDNQGLKLSSGYYLGELKSDEAVISLMNILKNSENSEERIMAALSLSKIGDARGIYVVKQAIKFDESERVRKLCSLFYQDFESGK
jgi:hypothetical protein